MYGTKKEHTASSVSCAFLSFSLKFSFLPNVYVHALHQVSIHHLVMFNFSLLTHICYPQNLRDLRSHSSECCWRADERSEQCNCKCRRSSSSSYSRCRDPEFLARASRHEHTTCLHGLCLCYLLALSLQCTFLKTQNRSAPRWAYLCLMPC